jgi:hypothetical protein
MYNCRCQAVPVSYEDTLPNPEDNPDFEELFSERKQNEIDARFQSGIALGIRKRRAERERRKAVERAREYAREHGPAPVKRAGFAKLGDVARVR